MKQFEIKNEDQNKWLVSHNEFRGFENKKFNCLRTITALSDPTGEVKGITF